MGKSRGLHTINRLLIDTEFAEISGDKLQLQLDTGAKIPELFPASRTSPLSQPWQGSLITSSESGGKVFRSRITLKIGATVVKDLNVLQNAHGSSLDAVGLLPAVIFRRIYISHSGGYVVLNPPEEKIKIHSDQRNRELAAEERGD
jgi:hypothetical protein